VHCSIEFTEDAREQFFAALARLPPQRVSDVLTRLAEASRTGQFKSDYGSAVIKIAITGRWRPYRNRTHQRYYRAQGGLRLLGFRAELLEGVQRIVICRVFNEEDPMDKNHYNRTVSLLAGPIRSRAGAYPGGKPCSERDDDNDATFRSQKVPGEGILVFLFLRSFQASVNVQRYLVQSFHLEVSRLQNKNKK